MLDEHCPKCGTPLFLIKETGLKYCPKCKVYLATEEELKRKGIDRTKAKIYDFEEYWKIKKEKNKTKKHKEKQDTSEETKEKRKVLSSQLEGAFNELIIVLLEKLIMKVEKEEMTIDATISMLEKIIEIYKKLK